MPPLVPPPAIIMYDTNGRERHIFGQAARQKGGVMVDPFLQRIEIYRGKKGGGRSHGQPHCPLNLVDRYLFSSKLPIYSKQIDANFCGGEDRDRKGVHD